MIETARYDQILGKKDFAEFVIQTKLKMKFPFDSTSFDPLPEIFNC